MRGWLIFLLTLALGWAAPPIAHAAPGDGVGVGSAGDDGTISAGAGYTREGVQPGRSNCAWTLYNVNPVSHQVGLVSWPREIDGVVYDLYLRHCPDGDTLVEVAQTDPADLLPALLRDLQTSVLPHPTPVFEVLDPEYGWAYVHTPLDFRAGGDSWRSVSVSASAGPVWATVTAVPSLLTFDPGDPAGDPAVSCSGDAATAPYLAETPGACSYTFVNASSTSGHDGYHFLTTLSIEWSITWTLSGGGAGSLPSFTTSATAELAVAEVKGLVTCTGPRSGQGGC